RRGALAQGGGEGGAVLAAGLQDVRGGAVRGERGDHGRHARVGGRLLGDDDQPGPRQRRFGGRRLGGGLEDGPVAPGVPGVQVVVDAPPAGERGQHLGERGLLDLQAAGEGGAVGLFNGVPEGGVGGAVDRAGDGGHAGGGGGGVGPEGAVLEGVRRQV